MSEKNIKPTSFRLDKDVLDKIKLLQEHYSNHLGIRVSQGEIIKIAVNSEYESTNLSKRRLEA